MPPVASLLRVLLPAAFAALAAAASASQTHTATRTASATVVTPSQTASASTFPSLTVEKWGLYDTSPTSVDPTILMPVYLLRSQIDNQLYLEFVNYVDAASNPPQSAWGRRAAGIGPTPAERRR